MIGAAGEKFQTRPSVVFLSGGQIRYGHKYNRKSELEIDANSRLQSLSEERN